MTRQTATELVQHLTEDQKIKVGLLLLCLTENQAPVAVVRQSIEENRELD